MTDAFKYQGDELVLFQYATNWKRYFSKQIKPFIKGNVLEAGAGIGTTTLLLNDGSATNWVMLEPDETMHSELMKKVSTDSFPSNTKLTKGTIEQVDTSVTFDTIIYIDVLEHIEADAAELEKAAALLSPGGYIIVLSPAFQSLFSPFDKAIGHFRRYNKSMLKKITPTGLEIVSLKYYDTIGYFAGLANKLLLRQEYPSKKQILFWDKWMVPVSTFTDQLFFHSFGKSIIGIWRSKTLNKDAIK
jgi:ubiquinone/menaquinone biosynthesis C-methylase UbiE